MAAESKIKSILETLVLRAGAIIVALVLFGGFLQYAKISDHKNRLIEVDAELKKLKAAAEADSLKARSPTASARQETSRLAALDRKIKKIEAKSEENRKEVERTVRAGPIEVLQLMYKASFETWFSFNITLTKAAPLILTALCVALPARLGLVVIGAEGALVIGAVAAGAISIPLHNAPPIVLLCAMAFCGIMAGGLWIMMVGALRHFRGVNETISGLLLNYIAIALLNHLVEGPLKDPSNPMKPGTTLIPDASVLGNIPGLDVHWGLAFGILFCLVGYFVIEHTTFGFAVRTAGGNVRAAKIVGLSVGLLTLIVCFAGGAAAGLAGMVEVAAVHKNANAAVICGYGYAGILVSFMARHNPIAIIPVAILLGAINASSGMLQRRGHLPDATVLVLQGILFVVILCSETLFGRFAIFKAKPAKEKPRSAPPLLPANLEGAAHG